MNACTTLKISHGLLGEKVPGKVEKKAVLLLTLDVKITMLVLPKVIKSNGDSDP